MMTNEVYTAYCSKCGEGLSRYVAHGCDPLPYQALPAVTYPKEKYAYRLRIRPERKTLPTGVARTMTRWFARCVRDQPVVMGMAHVELTEDFVTGRRLLLAWAPAFTNVAPEDREALASCVDQPDHRAVLIPRLKPFPWAPAKSADAPAGKNPPASGESEGQG